VRACKIISVGSDYQPRDLRPREYSRSCDGQTVRCLKRDDVGNFGAQITKETTCGKKRAWEFKRESLNLRTSVILSAVCYSDSREKVSLDALSRIVKHFASCPQSCV